ncbi:organic hydroperoxide resistance protein [Paenibacillus soyae]|uniref:Organic hydroperoxide resistance protein n=1 Tax=Paenibacillus soyae TaxID=2969249 RepID=A0A9X2MLC4_9BACL|nr:organic hydroperoxide resistance protein [Paenibacillus soyae]MCR2802766.1 organic hydroperoxide resistance protein [Paenibacillus soyae]
MSVLYTASVTVTGGREGQVASNDGAIHLKLSMPESLGGKGGSGTNPEQLFAAGYASCFDSALQLVIQRQKVSDVKGTEVTAHVSLLKDESDSGYKLGVKLNVKVAGVDQATASKLVEAAHQVCPYSKATRGNIEVETVSAVEAAAGV